jgi:hypothetical protein
MWSLKEKSRKWGAGARRRRVWAGVTLRGKRGEERERE